jgi:hypothetical protein
MSLKAVQTYFSTAMLVHCEILTAETTDSWEHIASHHSRAVFKVSQVGITEVK